MSQMPSISDAFRRVVSDTEAALIADTSVNFGSGIPKKLYFMHGHPKEIVAVLQSMTNAPDTKDKKYPLVALFRDIRETLVDQANGIGSQFTARFVICTLTTASLRAEDRKIKNFDPILVPILEEMIRQFTLSSDFGMPSLGSMNIKKWDRYFWGTQAMDRTILNDCVDAIEVESITLKLNNIC